MVQTLYWGPGLSIYIPPKTTERVKIDISFSILLIPSVNTSNTKYKLQSETTQYISWTKGAEEKKKSYIICPLLKTINSLPYTVCLLCTNTHIHSRWQKTKQVLLNSSSSSFTYFAVHIFFRWTFKTIPWWIPHFHTYWQYTSALMRHVHAEFLN